MLPETVDLHQVLASIPAADFSLDRLMQNVGQARGRRILAVPFPMPDVKQYGAWLAGPTVDVIFYDADTAKVHQIHIILHELSHIALGHKTLRVDSEDIGSLIRALRLVLMRDVSELDKSPDERAAESLAGSLQQEIIHKVGLHALTQRVATSPVWEDLAYGLGLDR